MNISVFLNIRSVSPREKGGIAFRNASPKRKDMVKKKYIILSRHVYDN